MHATVLVHPHFAPYGVPWVRRMNGEVPPAPEVAVPAKFAGHPVANAVFVEHELRSANYFRWAKACVDGGGALFIATLLYGDEKCDYDELLRSSPFDSLGRKLGRSLLDHCIGYQKRLIDRCRRENLSPTVFSRDVDTLGEWLIRHYSRSDCTFTPDALSVDVFGESLGECPDHAYRSLIAAGFSRAALDKTRCF